MTFFHITAALLFSLPDSPGGCKALGVSRPIFEGGWGAPGCAPCASAGDVTVTGWPCALRQRGGRMPELTAEVS